MLIKLTNKDGSGKAVIETSAIQFVVDEEKGTVVSTCARSFLVEETAQEIYEIIQQELHPPKLNFCEIQLTDLDSSSPVFLQADSIEAIRSALFNERRFTGVHTRKNGCFMVAETAEEVKTMRDEALKKAEQN